MVCLWKISHRFFIVEYMAKTRDQKEQIVKQYVEFLKDSPALVFVNFSGLKVDETQKLRRICKERNAKYFSAKKTLMKIAFQNAQVDFDPKQLEGEIGTIFGYSDEVTPAKIAADFSAEYPSLRIVGGILEKKFIGRDYVVALSKLPSKDELYAKVVGSLGAPLRGLVIVLSATMRDFVSVLKNIQERKQTS